VSKASGIPITFAPISPEWEQERYLEGIRLFNEHDFFQAHEVWEEIWRHSAGIQRHFYQGLIQCSVALEHYRRGNPRGVASLYNSYRKHFGSVPALFMSLDIGPFLNEMEILLRPVLDRVPAPIRGEIFLDVAQVPRIVLQGNPVAVAQINVIDA
jgi:uncharacterized protein